MTFKEQAIGELDRSAAFLPGAHGVSHSTELGNKRSPGWRGRAALAGGRKEALGRTGFPVTEVYPPCRRGVNLLGNDRIGVPSGHYTELRKRVFSARFPGNVHQRAEARRSQGARAHRRPIWQDTHCPSQAGTQDGQSLLSSPRAQEQLRSHPEDAGPTPPGSPEARSCGQCPGAVQDIHLFKHEWEELKDREARRVLWQQRRW